ncbi:apoptosis-inducing factor 3-like isoform X4 [Crassostrea virginica]
MGKGQSKSYDFTGESVKKRSGSKRTNGVEARTSKSFDPDTLNPPSDNENSQPINRTNLPTTQEEPTNNTGAKAENSSGALNSEKNIPENKQSGESSDTCVPEDSVINRSVEDSDNNKPVDSVEGIQSTPDSSTNEENREENLKSESTEQGPLEEEDLDKEIHKEAEEYQKEAVSEVLKEKQAEAQNSEEPVSKEEETEEPISQEESPQEITEETQKESLDNTTEEHSEETPKESLEEPQSGGPKESQEETLEEEENREEENRDSLSNTVEATPVQSTDTTQQFEGLDKDQEEPSSRTGELIQETTTSVDSEPEENMADTVSGVVCNESDLKDGDMKEFDLGEGKVLVVREGTEFYALGTKCSHYGAPLVNGSHCNGRVRCPWHGACFSVKTGDIEDFPGLDSIPKFKVNVTGGKVKVTAKKTALADPKVQRTLCKATKAGDKKVLIIGGGPSSVKCAETLRQEGFTGEITIATQENNLPYDRPKLSKAMDITADKIALRNAEFYSKADINILTQKQATSVDVSNKKVTFQDGSSESYTSLVLGTGGRPRVLPIPGKDLQNVYQLRTPEDANKIAEHAAGKNVVIIGSSFIGMEVASALAGSAATVSVVDIIKVPFQLVLGEKVGTVLQKMHEDNGVKFYFERGIKEFVGSDGKVTEAVLSDDTRLPADVCVMGVGVVPATDFIKGSGIEMTDRGFVPVNKMMQTNQTDVYATGDIVEFPLFSVEDKNVNIQHWQMAHAHGKTAALGILGRDEPIRSVPFFWTVQYKKSIRYTGYGPGYDDIVVHGDLDAPKFIAYYTKGDEVVAAASLNFDPFVARLADMMLAGEKVLKSEVQSDADGWMSRFEKLTVKA